jgi:hypothetical protein
VLVDVAGFEVLEVSTERPFVRDHGMRGYPRSFARPATRADAD